MCQACSATLLQGLAGMSNLKRLSLAGSMRSLEGISPGVEDLSLVSASDLVSLAGIEACSRIRSLEVFCCGVSSLHPLRSLSSMERLNASHCELLTHLSRIEQLKALRRLEVRDCAVTSLQPLSQLRNAIEYLKVSGCYGVEDVVLELPHIQPTAHVSFHASGVTSRWCWLRA
jgi:Leucine-rich repeat (LRR) protein